MTDDGREWVRRGGWTSMQQWHLRAVPTKATRFRTTVAACGEPFRGREVIATWAGDDGPPPSDRCAACQTVKEALNPIDA